MLTPLLTPATHDASAQSLLLLLSACALADRTC